MSKKDYQRVGWRQCPKCSVVGFAYRYKGRSYVKHPVTIAEAQQLTFADSGLQMMQKKQSTCYISKRSGRHFAIVTSNDKRLAINRTPAELPTPRRIAVFPGAV